MKKLLLLLSLCACNALAAPVNINTADAQAISDALSGIGPKKAEAIVKYRTEKGPFKSARTSHVAASVKKRWPKIKPIFC